MMRRWLALACVVGLASPSFAQVDASGSIVAGGTAQTAIPARTGSVQRQYVFCQNPIAATEALNVNVPGVAGAANGSYELAPGGSVQFFEGFIPQGAVSVYAVTTAHRYICKVG